MNNVCVCWLDFHDLLYNRNIQKVFGSVSEFVKLNNNGLKNMPINDKHLFSLQPLNYTVCCATSKLIHGGIYGTKKA